MATRQPTSTISYNSEAFLREKLESWYNAHIIQAYTYILHKGEDGDKDHIHLRIIPNKTLDVMNLTDDLKEFVIGKEKPLGVRPWRPSKEEDWFLYVVHYPQYMNLKYVDLQKGEKLPYDWRDIKCSSMFDLETAWIRSMQFLKHSATNLTSRLIDGELPMDLILQGENVFTINAVMKAIYQWDYPKLKNQINDLIDENRMLRQLLTDYGIDIK